VIVRSATDVRHLRIAMGLEDCVSRTPERQAQIKELHEIMGQSGHCVPSMYLYGNSSTGKSTVIRNIMETLSLPHIILNCFECISVRSMLEMLLSGLSDHSVGHGTNYLPWSRCETLSEFVRLVPLALDARSSKVGFTM